MKDVIYNWIPNKIFNKGDICRFLNRLYVCLIDGTVNILPINDTRFEYLEVSLSNETAITELIKELESKFGVSEISKNNGNWKLI